MIGAELVQCVSVFDEKGVFCPAFGEQINEMDIDQVILAIGQSTNLSLLFQKSEIKSSNNLIPVDSKIYETNVSGIFAGGDISRGSGSIIEAIADGRNVASVIDKYLGGDGNLKKRKVDKTEQSDYDGKRERGFADLNRVKPPTLPLTERHTGFSEVELCLDDDKAIEEAKRCLQCDLELCLEKKENLNSE